MGIDRVWSACMSSRLALVDTTREYDSREPKSRFQKSMIWLRTSTAATSFRIPCNQLRPLLDDLCHDFSPAHAAPRFLSFSPKEHDNYGAFSNTSECIRGQCRTLGHAHQELLHRTKRLHRNVADVARHIPSTSGSLDECCGTGSPWHHRLTSI